MIINMSGSSFSAEKGRREEKPPCMILANEIKKYPFRTTFFHLFTYSQSHLIVFSFFFKDVQIGQRMITISTVGVPNTMKKLASRKLQSTLAVRLVILYRICLNI